MLKNFLYLNEPALDGYLSSLEDGLRDSAEATSSSGKSGGGKLGAGPVGVEGSLERSDSERVTRADTPTARFERLVRLASADQDATGWIDVANPDDDLRDVGVGALIKIESDLYIPPVIKALSPSGQLAQTLGVFEQMGPLIQAFGLQAENMPSQDKIDALKSASATLGGDATFVGERDDTEWRIAGRLSDAHLRSDVEGDAIVIGKVSSHLPRGSFKPLLALPGMNLMSREQRREMERKGPAADQKENWLRGPALMLDVLAIYR